MGSAPRCSLIRVGFVQIDRDQLLLKFACKSTGRAKLLSLLFICVRNIDLGAHLPLYALFFDNGSVFVVQHCVHLQSTRVVRLSQQVQRLPFGRVSCPGHREVLMSALRLFDLAVFLNQALKLVA